MTCETAPSLTRAAGSAGPLGLPRTYWIVWATVLINRMATFVQPFLILFLVREKEMSLTRAGLVVTALGIGAIASSVLGGWLGDRLTRRTAMVTGQLISAASLLALAVAPTEPLVWLGALAVGLSSDLARPAQNALIADIVPPERRVRAYSMTFWALNLGFSVATLAAGVLSRWGYGRLFVIDAGATILSALVVATMVPRTPRIGLPVAHEHERRSVARAIVTDPRALALMVAAITYATVYQQAYTTLPLVMGRDGLSAAAYGAIVAANGVVIVLLQPLASRWLERFHPERVYAVSLLVVAVGFAGTLLASTQPTHLAAVVVWSVGEVGSAAVIGALFAALAPPHQRAGYMAAFSMTFSIGMALGPALGTWTLAHLGEPALWLGCGLALVVAASPVLRMRVPEVR